MNEHMLEEDWERSILSPIHRLTHNPQEPKWFTKIPVCSIYLFKKPS